MKTFLATLVVLFFLAARAEAQVDVGAAVGPDVFGVGSGEAKKEGPASLLPLAMATSLAFDATTWAQIKLSSAPAQALTAMFYKGYYKLELIQLILLAKRSGGTLSDLVLEREKGAKLRDMAKRLGLDYDGLYDRALNLDREVEERLLPSIMTVAVSTVPVVSGSSKSRHQ